MSARRQSHEFCPNPIAHGLQYRYFDITLSGGGEFILTPRARLAPPREATDVNSLNPTLFGIGPGRRCTKSAESTQSGGCGTAHNNENFSTQLPTGVARCCHRPTALIAFGTSSQISGLAYYVVHSGRALQDPYPDSVTTQRMQRAIKYHSIPTDEAW